MSDEQAKSPSIGDYAIIGDCRTAALISRHGSVDWLCWPRFDASSVFARILDSRIGGHWQIAPTAAYTTQRSYIEDTAVLQTRFAGANGLVVITDLMPAFSERDKLKQLTPRFELLRLVRCEDGEVEMFCDYFPRPDYGRFSPRMEDRGELGFRFADGLGLYALRSEAKLQLAQGHVTGTFCLKAGESCLFTLGYDDEAPSVLPLLGESGRDKIEHSIHWWKQWSGENAYDGDYRSQVRRSAIALKLLAYAPSGAIIAAPTTSLPEKIGGGFNWDYRYCWLRDASLTARALFGLGYADEASSWVGWMLNATHQTQPHLRVMYDVFGGIDLHERELPHLEGYRGSRPVRVGNGARNQLQMDVYGEVVDAVAQFAYEGGEFDRDTQGLLVDIGRLVCKDWVLPDQGIWEPRIEPRHHTHSKVLCWTALDRLIDLHEKGKLKKIPRELFCESREKLRQQIELRAWNNTIHSYTREFNGHMVDSALLLLAWYGFQEASHPRMQATYERICEDLSPGRGLLFRHKADPFVEGEGAFGICSFWGAEYLALAGRLQEARKVFEQLLQFTNDVGLYAEEIDPESGEPLGNFPQGFTHVGLINAALSIKRAEEGRKELPHREDRARRENEEKVS